MTINDPMRRFATLRCGDPYLCFHVAFYIPGTCPFQAFYFEKKLHALYERSRIEFHNGGRSEWFDIHFKEAEIQCEQFIENQFDQQDWFISRFSDYAYHTGTNILKAYEDDLISYFGPLPVLDEDGIPWQ